MQRLDTLSFAIAGGIYGAAFMALATIAALVGIHGFRPLPTSEYPRKASFTE